MNDKKREILNVRAIIQLRYNYNKIYVYILEKDRYIRHNFNQTLNNIKLTHIIISSGINSRRLYYCYILFPKNMQSKIYPTLKCIKIS